jgi:large repetitive protein
VDTILLIVYHPTNGCIIIDTISIIDQTIPPIAKAGEDVDLPCGYLIPLNADSSISAFGHQLSFEWSSLAKDTQSTGAVFTVSKTGTYILEVTDEVTGCVASDTVLVRPDVTDPIIQFNVDDFELNCKNEMLMLEAKVLNDSNYTFAWTTTNPSGFANPSGTANSLNRTIIAPGVYTLNVDIDNSLCSLTRSIEVTENSIPPVARISSTGDTITCYNPEINLSIIDFTPDTFYQIEWFRDGQLVASDSLEIRIQQGGNYEFVITDTLNGCLTNERIVIRESKNVPLLVLSASGGGVLDCQRTSLDLIVFPPPFISQLEISINWETDTGNITTYPDFFTARINKPGTYKAILTNLINGCSVQKDTFITTNVMPPVANASVDGKLTCDNPQRQLSAIGSSIGENFKPTWKNATSPSSILSTDITTDINLPGTYILTILNTQNSCDASDTVIVETDNNAPNVIIQQPEILTCAKDTIILNAMGTDFSPNFTYVWKGIENQNVITATNPLFVQVVSGGGYQLSVKNNQNGCIDSVSVIVSVDQEFPQANAGPQKILECINTPVALDGSGSSQGDNFTYFWSAISGGSMLNNPTILSPQVTHPGIYKLVVSNQQTNCKTEDTVTVILNPNLISAQTGPDQLICESESVIVGNLPTGTTGLWRKITQDAILGNPELPSSSVDALVPGNNLFEWSLSVPTCSNYSKDTINVEVAKAPIASDDALLLTNGQTQAIINILANDFIQGPLYSISLLNAPNVGRVSNIESGTPQYSVRGGYFGADFFTYLLCNEYCENLCDTATVFIDIPFDEDYKAPPLPNAITPNGDGLNDFLEFELLEDPGTIYPDNELLIFNRWGDIVYRARPYNNDWSGRGNDGKELPHGTYYYVLRLNISEGIILKGDVTILQRN